MIKSVIYPDEYCFIGNPMIITIEGDSAEEVVVDIMINNEQIIDLSFLLFGSGSGYKNSYDISKIIAPFFQKHAPSVGSIIAPLEGFILNYSITVRNFSTGFSGKALYGGINNYNYARLKEAGLNMFSYRLMNYNQQFLFTTRTNANQICLRETELYPFVFIHPGEDITIITSAGRVVIPNKYSKNTVCTLDIEAVRKLVFETYRELPSYMAVTVGEKTIFQISIAENQLSEENYLVRFRNSLGAYELIELTGTATDQTTFPDEDTWMGFHPYNFFEEKRNRVSSRAEIVANTGYKTKEELAFLLDMVKSDEIYFTDLSDPDRKEYRCLVTPEELQVPRKIVVPQSLSLNIRLVSDEQYVSPDIVFEYPTYIFQNLTAPGRPELNGEGFIYADDYPFYAE